jgi:flagellar hook-associated protein 3 FlgL
MNISRLSTTYSYLQSLDHISNAFENVVRLQEQLTTGKQINRPSDDPAGMQQILRFNSTIQENAQYVKNIDRSKGRLQAASTTLQQVEDMLTEMRDLALSASSVTTSSAERNAYATQVDLMLDHLVNLVNTRYEGKFLFGGTQTVSGGLPLSAPFNLQYDSNGVVSGVAANPRGINELVFINVTRGVRDSINISGSAPFQPNGYKGTGDMFDSLIRLRDALKNNNPDAIKGLQNELTGVIMQVTEQDTVVGAKINRMEVSQTTLKALAVDEKAQKSAVEDIDYAKLMIEFSTAQTLLNATLSATSTVLQNSLMNFI